MEDSFGFSWGFPPTESLFPLTGYFPFFKGAAAYRFFTQDAIGFDQSLRVFAINPDHFEGGRKQTVIIAGQSHGPIENFQDGRWIEQRVGPSETAEGKVLIRAVNARQGSNAVVSIVEWVGADE